MAWRELHEVGPSTGAARPTVPQPGEPPGPCAPGWGPSCARPCEAVVRDMAKVWQGQNWVRVALGPHLGVQSSCQGCEEAWQ